MPVDVSADEVIPVVLDVVDNDGMQRDVIASGVIAARKLIDAFDFNGVFVVPLPAARLWPAGHSLLVCFPLLLEFSCLFPI
jgi:hypothetical protein